MYKSALEVLFNYIERSQIDLGSKILLVNGYPHPALALISNRLTVVQTSASVSKRLLSSGVKSTPRWEALKFDSILFLGTKYATHNLEIFRRSLSLLNPNGVLLCAMANELGAKRFNEELEKISGLESFSHSKSKCRVFGVAAPDSWNFQPTAPLECEISNSNLSSHFASFSNRKIDEASKILANNLPSDLAGTGIDLGAGYGYLSHEALATSQAITLIDLFEDDYDSLTAASLNLKNFEGRYKAHWEDVTSYTFESKYDFVLTNPPYHQGNKFASSLGEEFIKKGITCLRDGGRLFAVNQKVLPYIELASKVGTVTELTSNNLFVAWCFQKGR